MPNLPPLFVELKADVSNFTAKLSSAQSQVTRMAKQNATDYEKLATVGKGALLGLGAAAVSVAALSIKAGAEQEAANARLTASLYNAGSSMTALSKPMQAAQDQARKLGFADDEAAKSLSLLVNATKSPALALRDLALAEDVARGRGIDLAAATDIITKVETGHVALLGRLGINIKDATGATISQADALKRLSELYGGQASAFAGTFEGRLATLRAEVDNLAEGFGNVLIPKVEALAHVGAGALEWIGQHRTQSALLAAVIAGPLVQAMTAYVAVQAANIARTGAQLALRLPQFFLDVGAAIRGTTAAEVVLGETTAATHMTMLLGAAAVGTLAAGLGFLTMRMQENQAKSREWAHNLAVAAGDPKTAIAQLTAEADAMQKQLDSHGLVAHIPFVRMAVGAQTAEDKISALRSEVKALRSAQAGLAATTDEAGAAEDNFGQRMDALRNGLLGLVAAQQNYKQAQYSVTTATDNLADAHRALDDLLRKGAVDTQQVTQAQRDLAASQRAVKAAQDQVNAAKRKFDELEKGANPRDVQRAQIAVNEAIERLTEVSKDATSSEDDRQSAQLDLADAQDHLTELIHEGAVNTDAYTATQKELTDAQQNLEDATQAQTDATERLNQAQAGDPTFADQVTAAKQRLRDAENQLAQAKDGVATSAMNLYDAQQKENDALSSGSDTLQSIISDFNTVKGQFPEAGGLIDSALAIVPFLGALQEYIRGGGSSSSISDGLIRFGGHFASGGMVPGPVGSPSLIVAHGGEEVLTPAQQAAAGGLSVTVGQIVVQGATDPQATATAVRDELLKLARRNVNVGLS